jgi:predicted ATP-dependent endonuclease of OLD family
MIVLKKIQIKNYRNIQHLLLDGLKDVNILIGPNNCGKTHILQSLNLLNKVDINVRGDYWNGEKSLPIDSLNNYLRDFKFLAPFLATSRDESYFRNSWFEISYYFDQELLKKKIKDILKKNENELFEIIKKFPFINISSQLTLLLKKIFENDNAYKLTFKQSENLNFALSSHPSFLLIKGVFEEVVRNKILLIEDARIERYKKTSLKEYLESKNLSGEAWGRLIEFLRVIVDPSIKDYKQKSLDLIKNNNFETSIEEQGSGVKSLICIAADILSSEEESIILLDEPELGLNPFAKQEFLKFLFKESKNKQIFVVTHDPTFVNPILWEDKKTSVYFYSVIDRNFQQINLRQNKEDPSVFAGYLPHTISLKDIHFYVEGTSDVYIFQILLRKYLQEMEISKGENKYEFFNKIGIYHLGGDYWEHLLYTIPRPPYKCVVILDGDKKAKVKEVIEKYNNASINTAKFQFCQNVDEVGLALSENMHPVYCLKEECIEKYIFSDFECKNPPQGYVKSLNGPEKAEKMNLKEIPDEIRQLFETIFGTLKFGKKKKVFISEKIK